MWIGFPGSDPAGVRVTGPSTAGIIIRIRRAGYRIAPRVDVQWGDGTFGEALYIQTIEVISEAR